MNERLEELQNAVASIKEAVEKLSVEFSDATREEFLGFVDDSIRETLGYEIKELQAEIADRDGAAYESSRKIDYNNATRG